MAKAADQHESPAGLPQLLGPLRDKMDLSYEELLKRGDLGDGEIPSRPWLYRVVTGQGWSPGWVGADNMRRLAKIFGLPHAAIYQANAVSLGLDLPTGGGFAASIPGWVDKLPAGDQIAIRDIIFRLGEARGLTR